MTELRIMAFAVGTLLLAGCSADGTENMTPQQRSELSVLMTQTDPAVSGDIPAADPIGR